MADIKEVTILDYVKNAIGVSVSIDASDDLFDTDLIVLIDGALSTLYQNGVGTPYPNRINNDKNLSRDKFFNNDIIHDRGNAIQYVVLKTKLLFDPPLPATINAIVESNKESLYRARMEFDDNDSN